MISSATAQARVELMPDIPDKTAIEQYDLAISFAGDDRNTAREIATRITARGYRVFFAIESQSVRGAGRQAT